MSHEFLATPDPEKCTTYGPRLWVKLYPAQRFGTPDEIKLYRRLCELCCWGGEDRTYYAESSPEQAPHEEDPTAILSFEFPFTIPRDDDDGQTLFERGNYGRAIEELTNAGYIRLVNDIRGSTEFFRGFEK